MMVSPELLTGNLMDTFEKQKDWITCAMNMIVSVV